MKELNEKQMKAIGGGKIGHRVEQYVVMKDSYLYTKLMENQVGKYAIDNSDKKLLKRGTKVKVLLNKKYYIRNAFWVKVSTLDRKVVGYFKLGNLKRDVTKK